MRKLRHMGHRLGQAAALAAAAGSMVLPWPIRRRVLVRAFGYELSRTSRIGFSLVMPRRLSMGDGARIGHFNVIRNLDALTMDERATIGSGNWISAYPSNRPPHFTSQPGRSATLTLGRHAAVTSRHRFDCTDAVSVGAFSTVAGWQSQILTHSINLAAGRQEASGVRIGERCFVGTKCTVLPGGQLPDFCVLGAMSLLNTAPSATHQLYGGTPARPLKALDAAMAYFTRQTGYVE